MNYNFTLKPYHLGKIYIEKRKITREKAKSEKGKVFYQGEGQKCHLRGNLKGKWGKRKTYLKGKGGKHPKKQHFLNKVGKEGCKKAKKCV